MEVQWVLILYLLALLATISVQQFEDDEVLQLINKDIITDLNPPWTEDGDIIVEGDMVLPPSDEGNDLEERKGVVNIVTLWPNGVVAYNYHSSVSSETKALIEQAIEHWEEKTCLRFTEKILDFSYLRFRTDKEGCWSFIGRMTSPFSGQDVSIGRGCTQVDIIVHEIGHALGFYHEQSRNDRDSYIDIIWNNMKYGTKSQFDRGMESPRGVEYDYTSVMHYGAMAFSGRIFEKNTITSKNPHHQGLIGKSRGLSFRDSKLANILYSCNSLCPNQGNDTLCLNKGFLGPYRRDREPCPCVCPPDTTGDFCETMISDDYYEKPICGGNVTEEIEIETPGYPVRRPPADTCSWWLRAPVDKRVQVEFMDFSFRPRLVHNSSKYSHRCVYERVEIRTNDNNDGEMFCGEDIPPGTVAHSLGRDFIIIIDTNNLAQKGRGLKAKVSFID